MMLADSADAIFREIHYHYAFGCRHSTPLMLLICCR
jgi:hypothetical protein